MDKYLCDWGGADYMDDLSAEAVAVGGVPSSGGGDGSAGAGGGVVGLHDWERDAVLGL